MSSLAQSNGKDQIQRMLSRGSETLIFEDITIQVERKAFRRGLSLRVSPQHPPTVKVGMITSRESIQKFLNEKKFWLRKHLEEIQRIKEKTPRPQIRHGEKLWLRGLERNLEVVPTLTEKVFFSLDQESIFLHLPSAIRSEIQGRGCDFREVHFPYSDLLSDFYAQEARRWITARVEHWSQIMELFPTSIKFRFVHTRWGSCSRRGALNFNSRLIVFPPALIDYVVIHELAHLKHLNHSQKFWDLVEKFCPDHKTLSAELKAHHFMADFLEKR